MSNVNPRQRALLLIARLYELAADYSDEELLAILRDQSRKNNNSAVVKAIQALVGIHKETEESAQFSLHGRYQEMSDRLGLQSAEFSSLAKLLDDRSSFPTVGDIANATGIAARPKEARERYISRLVRKIEGMSASERMSVFERVAKGTKAKSGSFIASWSKLIKEM